MTRVTRSRTISMLAIATLLTVGVASSASAQNAVVTGRVMSDRGQPLYGANVYITELNISVATNEAGTYTINVPAARVSGQTVALRARAVGFRPESQPLTVSAGTQTLNFDLEKAGHRVQSAHAAAGEDPRRVDRVRLGPPR